jgi:pimeloyl-ACP methyl ester carboxylesterase
LVARRRVLIPDLPGYRGEPALEGRDRFQRTTTALVDELDKRRIGRAAVVGFSGGAYRAVALACEHPDRIDHLMLLGGYARLDEGLRAGLRQVAQLLRQGADLRGGFASLMLSPGYAAAHPDAVVRVSSWLDLTSTTDLASEMESFAEAPDYAESFSRLQIPITLRTGALDRAAFVEEARVGGRLNPRANVQIVEGCGHALLIEDRVNTLAAIIEALE